MSLKSVVHLLGRLLARAPLACRKQVGRPCDGLRFASSSFLDRKIKKEKRKMKNEK
ncbi:MAG: hypothetical protein ACJAVK_000179 [Akkermansiaceae bacterium]|jgi:hypothetical protein